VNRANWTDRLVFCLQLLKNGAGDGGRTGDVQLGIQTYVGSKITARFCCDFLNLQASPNQHFQDSTPNEAQTRQVLHAKSRDCRLCICAFGRMQTPKWKRSGRWEHGIRNSARGAGGACTCVRGKNRERQAKSTTLFSPVLYRSSVGD